MCLDSLGVTLIHVVSWVVVLSSHLHIVAMAVQRYFAVVFPFRYHVWVTKKRLRVTVAAMWTVSVTYGLTDLAFGWDTRAGADGCGQLSVPKAYSGLSQLAIFVLVLITLSFTYGSILRIARQKTSQVIDVSAGGPPDRNRNERKGKAHKFTTAVILTYTVTWSVYFCGDIVEVIHPWLLDQDAWDIVEYVSFLLAFSNSCVNVFIYSYYLPEFRVAYQNLLGSCRQTDAN